jgi:amidophosphoribosyltransferase
MGLVSEVFTRETIKKLRGSRAIGHVRYSTAGASHIKNAQPFVVEYSRGSLAVAHNGNLTNGRQIRDELEAYGSIFQSTMDTEVIIHLIAQSREPSLPDRVVAALQQLKGAYSLVFLGEEQLIAVRDPNGFRPLVLGELEDAHVIASETCAFDLIGAEYVRDVEPGEVLVIDEKGLRSIKPFENTNNSLCVFEFIYFARPDSIIADRSVYSVRVALGRQLAREHPVEADMVIPIPAFRPPLVMPMSLEYPWKSD